jgi:hypothetical protein
MNKHYPTTYRKELYTMPKWDFTRNSPKPISAINYRIKDNTT